jgi:hypothetical protein
MTITLRIPKGSELTHAELDGNFTDLDGRASTAAAHAASTSNPHATTKTQVGLGNADNTSDANKPVSTAQQTALNAKADLLAPVTETATTGTLTKSGHTSRELTVTNAAAITRTFDFTSMVVGDGGVVIQGGAGAIALASASGAGAPFVYAPGVTASPTTAGQHGSIAWTLIDATAGNQVVRIDYRSQVAAGGGGGWGAPVTIAADVTLTQSTHAERTLLIASGYRTLTVETDATAGTGSGSRFYALPAAPGVGYQFSAAGGVTIRALGAAANVESSGARGMMLEWVAANTWQVTTPLDPIVLRGGQQANSSLTFSASSPGVSYSKISAGAVTYTVPPAASVNVQAGGRIPIGNGSSSGDITIARGAGVTLYVNGADANVTLTPGQCGVLWKAIDGLDTWFFQRG